jgi:short subunit dehydrogenase-like uncharacterized protein
VTRIVVFGASGYTGGLAARAVAARGLRPVLAGRSADALERLAEELGGLETAHADADAPSTVRGLVERGDVLVTTVGPMARSGRAALDAAIDAGAHYVDSSGESSWVREVFERAGSRAARAEVVLVPAMAYDSAPGNLAGALALREAGGGATRVRIGYFLTGAGGGLRGGLRQMSGGSRATFVRMALERGFAYRGGRLVTERGSARVGAFEVDGRVRRGVSFGTSEAFSLPRLFPRLLDVEVFFGWFDGASRLLQAGALPLAALTAARPVRDRLATLADRLAPAGGRPPADRESGSLFVAEAFAPGRRARARLAGINGYRFSGNLLAWAAAELAAAGPREVGARGPVEAFGLERLEAGVAEAGIRPRGRASI